MSRERRESPYRAEELQALVDTLPSTLPCLNPRCRGLVGFRQRGAGRQPAFCGDHCRASFHNERLRLRRALEAVTRTSSLPAVSGPDPALGARLRWVLARYR